MSYGWLVRLSIRMSGYFLLPTFLRPFRSFINVTRQFKSYDLETDAFVSGHQLRSGPTILRILQSSHSRHVLHRYAGSARRQSQLLLHHHSRPVDARLYDSRESPLPQWRLHDDAGA